MGLTGGQDRHTTRRSPALPTVLVVDDDDELRAALEAILQDAGYAVLIADSGHDALEIIAHAAPAVVLLDLMMPHMDGFTFVNELTRRGLRARTSIIVLTAHDRARPLVAQMGADGYVQKPFKIDDLIAAVARFAGAGA